MIRLLAAIVALVVATNAAGYSAPDEIRADQLPPGAIHTIRLTERGGPFPFAKDGSVFANRERGRPFIVAFVDRAGSLALPKLFRARSA